jgi:hypothetical protein
MPPIGRPLPALSPPHHRRAHALIRPILRPRRQTSANRIFLHISPFLRITLLPSQTRVPEVALPFTRLGKMEATELSLPMRYPRLKCEVGITRSAKEMKVIRHEQIITNQPGVRSAPDILQSILHVGRSQPRLSVFCAYGQVNDGRFVRWSEHAVSGSFSTRLITWSVTGRHGQSNSTRRRKSQGRRHAVPPIEFVCLGGPACCRPCFHTPSASLVLTNPPDRGRQTDARQLAR